MKGKAYFLAPTGAQGVAISFRLLHITLAKSWLNLSSSLSIQGSKRSNRESKSQSIKYFVLFGTIQGGSGIRCLAKVWDEEGLSLCGTCPLYPAPFTSSKVLHNSPSANLTQDEMWGNFNSFIPHVFYFEMFNK